MPIFVKQLGGNPVRGILEPLKVGDWQEKEPLKLQDSKGGDMAEWPSPLRVREMPKIISQSGGGYRQRTGGFYVAASGRKSERNRGLTNNN